MTDEHPENNRVLHELLGRCWHEDISDTGFPRECSCGGSNCNIRNPDYADDPRLVLEGMKYASNFQMWLDELPDLGMIKVDLNELPNLGMIKVDLVLDKTGKLRDLAIEFLKEGK